MSDLWSDLLAAHDQAGASADGRVPEHRPSVAVLACSDARVPPSVVFDQPAGSLFVVRVAGNTAGPRALASLDYAVAQLGVELLIVLGHTHCGAVAAAFAGDCDGELAAVTAPICAVIDQHPHAEESAIVRHNVTATLRALAAHDGPTGRATRAGRLAVVGAVHDLATGRLEDVAGRSLPSTHPSPEAS